MKNTIIALILAGIIVLVANILHKKYLSNKTTTDLSEETTQQSSIQVNRVDIIVGYEFDEKTKTYSLSPDSGLDFSIKMPGEENTNMAFSCRIPLKFKISSDANTFNKAFNTKLKELEGSIISTTQAKGQTAYLTSGVSRLVNEKQVELGSLKLPDLIGSYHIKEIPSDKDANSLFINKGGYFFMAFAKFAPELSKVKLSVGLDSDKLEEARKNIYCRAILAGNEIQLKK